METVGVRFFSHFSRLASRSRQRARDQHVLPHVDSYIRTSTILLYIVRQIVVYEIR